MRHRISFRRPRHLTASALRTQDTPSLVISAISVPDSGRFVLCVQVARSFCTLSVRPVSLGKSYSEEDNPSTRAAIRQLGSADLGRLNCCRSISPAQIVLGKDYKLVITGRTSRHFPVLHMRCRNLHWPALRTGHSVSWLQTIDRRTGNLVDVRGR